MRFLKKICYGVLGSLSLASAMSAALSEVQDGSRFDVELNERDFEALRQYLNTKRDVPLEDKDLNLTISGDVRFEWRHMRERWRGLDWRGKHRRNPFTNIPVSRNDFDAEFNLKFDYIMDRSWAVAHLQYDNSAGVDSQDLPCTFDHHGWFGSGRCDDLCLRKAYMGYNFWMDPCSRFDVELGRRGNLYHVFDSRVQFLSRFDGILLKWSGAWENVSEWFVKLGGLVVDERVNHFAYVTELGFLNIMDSGFDFKYSFIDWCYNGRGRCLPTRADLSDPEILKTCAVYIYDKSFDPKAFDFAVSQFTLAYNIDPELLCMPAKVYGAFLMNHKWKRFNVRNETGDILHSYRANLAWYVGALFGQVRKEGDLSLEVQWQVVQALAVPGQDMSGIGTGNVFDYTLTSLMHIDNTNFRGWKVEGLYALTDNITMDMIIENSWADNPHIGGSHSYSKVEVEAIYAF